MKRIIICADGTWNVPGVNFNHAKIGVSTGDEDYAIFGDLNQQGMLSGSNCGSSLNGRGGLFFVIKDHDLNASAASLLTGADCPQHPGSKLKVGSLRLISGQVRSESRRRHSEQDLKLAAFSKVSRRSTHH